MENSTCKMEKQAMHRNTNNNLRTHCTILAPLH